MHVIIPILVGAAYKACCKIVQDQQRAKTRNRTSNDHPHLTCTIESSHAPQDACAMIDRFLAESGAILKQRSSTASLYGRGDPSITRLPIARQVAWHEIPIWIGFGHGTIGKNGKTQIHVDFRAFSTTAYSEHAAEQFRELAEREFWRMVEHLDTAEVPRSGANGAAPAPDESLLADLESLGLALGVTWEQVQATYRALSRKYHPDRFTGQRIDPDIIELAQQRFAEIAAAYQRLRSRMNGAA